MEGTLSHAIDKRLRTYARASVSSIVSSQTIDLSDLTASGDIDIRGVRQVTVANIDPGLFLGSINEPAFDEILDSSMREANMSATAIARVKNDYTYRTFQATANQFLGTQTIQISDVEAGDIEISDISQYLQVQMLAGAMAREITRIATETSAATQQSYAPVNGGSITTIILIILCIVVILAGVGAYFWLALPSPQFRGK